MPAKFIVKVVCKCDEHRAMFPIFNSLDVSYNFAAACHIFLHIQSSIETMSAFNTQNNIYNFFGIGFLCKIGFNVLKTSNQSVGVDFSINIYNLIVKLLVIMVFIHQIGKIIIVAAYVIHSRLAYACSKVHQNVRHSFNSYYFLSEKMFFKRIKRNHYHFGFSLCKSHQVCLCKFGKGNNSIHKLFKKIGRTVMPNGVFSIWVQRVLFGRIVLKTFTVRF